MLCGTAEAFGGSNHNSCTSITLVPYIALLNSTSTGIGLVASSLSAEEDGALLLLLLFLTFSVLVANPKKLLYTVANPARGLLNRDYT